MPTFARLQLGKHQIPRGKEVIRLAIEKDAFPKSSRAFYSGAPAISGKRRGRRRRDAPPTSLIARAPLSALQFPHNPI